MSSVSVGHIELDERGVAHVAGRRTKVVQIVVDKQARGWSAEEIAEQYPHLTLAEIHAALAYYYDHRTELDEQIARDLETADRPRLEAGPLPIGERLRRRATSDRS